MFWIQSPKDFAPILSKKKLFSASDAITNKLTLRNLPEEGIWRKQPKLCMQLDKTPFLESNRSNAIFWQIFKIGGVITLPSRWAAEVEIKWSYGSFHLTIDGKNRYTSFGGLASFGGSLLLGFISGHNFLTLLSRGRYFRRFTRVCNSQNISS